MKNQSKVFVLSFQFFHIFILSFLSLSVIFSLFAARAHTAQVTLTWNPNAEADLAGYKIYYGFETGNYSYSIDVGDITSCTIFGLEENRAIYLVATAYNVNGNESAYSEQVVFNAENQLPVTRDTVYENAGDGKTYGWSVYDNSPTGATISNVYDEDHQSRVIQLDGSGIVNGYVLRNEDGSSWHNSEQFTIQWSMKYVEDFVVYLDVKTTEGHRYLRYEPNDYDDLGSGEYVHHGLGSLAIDGQWHTFTRDLEADLEDAQPGVTILEINGFLIRGSGRVDDIKLLYSYPSGKVYEDAEDSTTTGWSVYDNSPTGAAITNVYDEDHQSRVIRLDGTGTGNGYVLRNEDGRSWHNSEQFTIQWSMKYVEDFKVYVDVETTAGHRYIYYTPNNYDDLGSGEYVHHGLGSYIIDGQWHTFTRDLQADLEDAQPGVTILEVNGFLIRGSGRVDNIKLLYSYPSGKVYEDAEDSTTTGWSVYDNSPTGATISNVYDEDHQSRVIRLDGTGTGNGYVLRNEDGSSWHNSEQFTIQWSMKYEESFKVYVDVETTAGHRYVYYTPNDYDDLGSGEYVHHGLGSPVTDGQWHTFTRDLQAELEDAQPGVRILEVNGFLIRGSGKVDNIKLTSF